MNFDPTLIAADVLLAPERLVLLIGVYLLVRAGDRFLDRRGAAS